MPERPTDYAGILCIGDPHLCSRTPGFRKDDYPAVTLGKLRWSLDYARREQLVPVILGDLFHYPRDNSNRLIVDLIELLRGDVLCIYGNHDCNENALTEDDTLSVLLSADRMRLLDDGPQVVSINGTRVAIGGTSWNRPLPERVTADQVIDAAKVLWVTHYDFRFPGHEQFARVDCGAIDGVSLVVNGHIHKRLDDVQAGETTWCNPGNITRIKREDACKAHVPAVLRISYGRRGWERQRVEVPHQPFEEVFHAELIEDRVELTGGSGFIDGLKTLQQIKTRDGEGLMAFLEKNVTQFENALVQKEILNLATEVLQHA